MKKTPNKSLTTSNISILFLGVLTALIHLVQPYTLLKLNGLGYILLTIGAVFTIKEAKALQEVSRKMLIVYAITTITMFFVLMGDSALGYTTGLITKVVELWLIATLAHSLHQKKKSYKVWEVQSKHHLMTRR